MINLIDIILIRANYAFHSTANLSILIHSTCHVKF